MAADAAFWAVFSLPWMLLALISGLGVASPWFGGGVRSAVQHDMIALADNVVGTQAAASYVVPAINELFSQGRSSVSVVGLLIALYSGSRAAASFLRAVGILTNSPHRGILHGRLISLALYIGAIVVLALGLSIVTVGTDNADAQLRVTWVSTFVDPLLVIALTSLLTLMLMYLGTSPRIAIRRHAPAVGLAVLLYAGCVLVLYLYVEYQTARGSLVVGLLVTPVAIMFFGYLLSWSVLAAVAANAVRLGMPDYSVTTPVGAKLATLKSMTSP
jgi:membrane protein